MILIIALIAIAWSSIFSMACTTPPIPSPPSSPPGAVPRYAVAWAAFFSFIAFAVFGLHAAAATTAPGSFPQRDRRPRDLRRLMGAIVWNVVTWRAFRRPPRMH